MFKKSIGAVTLILGTAILSACTSSTEISEGQLKDKATQFQEQLRESEGDSSLVVTTINMKNEGGWLFEEGTTTYTVGFSKYYGLEDCTATISEGTAEFTDVTCKRAE